MKKTSLLEEHYNKFSEDKRLTRRHGQVEFLTSMKYINKYLQQILDKEKNEIKILDIGAGTGRYAIPLSQEGYDVTALELVKYNIGILKSKGSNVQAIQGNALNLKKLKSDSFDVTLLFGPMYHLFSQENKEKALLEAKRVTKQNGVIFVAYLMNEYSIIVHGFRDGFMKECMEKGKVTDGFTVHNAEEDLYDYVRIEDIDQLNQKVGLERLQMIAATGPANYMRQVLNGMDDEMFDIFMNYHYSTCERGDLMGASSHVVDILTKR